MEQITTVGIDLAKNVFSLHGVDGLGRTVLRRTVGRERLARTVASLSPCLIGMEACSGAHEWGRRFERFGHTVKLMAPKFVAPYRKSGKNDGNDAEAICEAVSRPSMRFVPVKSAEQQAALMLMGIRDGLIARRTQLTNTIRGHAAEYGLIAPKGLEAIEPLLARIAQDEMLPALARELFVVLGRECGRLESELEAVEAKLMAWHRGDATGRRLAQIPSIGPIIATMLVMKTPDPHAFRSGRHFAAWLGLTPKDHSTAGKTRLGKITRAGDEDLRRLLVVGATAVIQQASKGRGQHSRWLLALIKRKPPKLAAVALANKVARIVWKLMVTGESYDAARLNAVATGAA